MLVRTPQKKLLLTSLGAALVALCVGIPVALNPQHASRTALSATSQLGRLERVADSERSTLGNAEGTAEAEAKLAELVAALKAYWIDRHQLRHGVVEIANLPGGPAVLLRFLHEGHDYLAAGWRDTAAFHFSLRYHAMYTLVRRKSPMAPSALEHVLQHPVNYWELLIAGKHLVDLNAETYYPMVCEVLEARTEPLWNRQPGDEPLDGDMLFYGFALATDYGREDLFPQVLELYTEWAGGNAEKMKATPIGRYFTILPGEQQERLLGVMGERHPLLEASVFSGKLVQLDLTRPGVKRLVEGYLAQPETRDLVLRHLTGSSAGQIMSPLIYEQTVLSYQITHRFDSVEHQREYNARMDALDAMMQIGAELAGDVESRTAVDAARQRLRDKRREAEDWPIGGPEM